MKGNFLFKAAPHNSARDSSERFCSKIKFGKRRNTGCLSSFSNCNIGAKDPLMSADAIVRCCLSQGYLTTGGQAFATGFFLFNGKYCTKKMQLTHAIGCHPVRRVCTRGQFESVTLVVVEHRWGSPGSEMCGRWLGGAAAPRLSLWESWHGAAVTERVPCSNHRIFPNLPLPTPSQAR